MRGMTDQRNLEAVRVDGTFDDETLIELSKTAAGRDALKIAMAIEADAQMLAQNVAAEFETTTRIAHVDRSRHAVRGTRRGHVARWAAVAAAVAFGFALFLQQGTQVKQAPVAGQAPVVEDRILAGDFEGVPAADAQADDALFVDDFGA
jgi:hypothetical protein